MWRVRHQTRSTHRARGYATEESVVPDSHASAQSVDARPKSRYAHQQAANGIAASSKLPRLNSFLSAAFLAASCRPRRQPAVVHVTQVTERHGVRVKPQTIQPAS